MSHARARLGCLKMGHALPIIGHCRGKILLRQRVNVLRRHLHVDAPPPQHVQSLDEDVHVAAEDVQMPAEDVQVSTQHVHVPAEHDWMTAEHVEGLAEEKISGGVMQLRWQENQFALAAAGSGCYLPV